MVHKFGNERARTAIANVHPTRNPNAIELKVSRRNKEKKRIKINIQKGKKQEEDSTIYDLDRGGPS